MQVAWGRLWKLASICDHWSSHVRNYDSLFASRKSVNYFWPRHRFSYISVRQEQVLWQLSVYASGEQDQQDDLPWSWVNYRATEQSPS